MNEFPSPATDATVVDDLVARERRAPGTAIRAPVLGRTMSYRATCATAAKAGNYLRHLGVARVESAPNRGLVVVAPAPRPEPVLTCLGAATLGAATRFGPARNGTARVIVVGGEAVDSYDPPPGATVVAYGDTPDSPAVASWEPNVWSENPALFPATVEPDDTIFETHASPVTHAAALDAARSVIDRAGVEPGDDVVLRLSLADSRAVTAGVVAPLLVGATVVFPGPRTCGDVAIATAGDDAPESTVVAPNDLRL